MKRAIDKDEVRFFHNLQDYTTTEQKKTLTITLMVVIAGA
jgi:hypothetical protein